MSVKKSKSIKLNPSSQRRISGAVNDVIKISSNSTVSPAQRSIRAAHADPFLSASALNVMSSQAQRFVRAAGDPLSAAVAKMQKVARLTTGIHIQLGLISGSIQSDLLISELLHLGSVTPTQIIALDSGKLQSAMTSIQGLSGKLTVDASTKRTEEKLNALNVMRDMVKGITGDITKWPGKTAFETEMKTVEANGVEVKIPEEVHSAVKSWNEKLKEIKKKTIDSSDQNSVSRMGFLVQDLNQLSADLLTAIATLTSTADPKPWKITSATEALSPIIQAVNSVEHAYTGYTVLKGDLNDANHAKNYKSTYTNLSGASKLVTDAAPGLQIFHVVSKSRGSPSTMSSGFPGFSNGFLDIGQLFVDLGDVWIGKVTDPKSMEAALSSLKTLTSGFGSVDNTLGVTSDQRKKVIADFLDLVNGIRSVPTTEADYTAAFGEYAGCSGKFNLLTPHDVKPVKDFIGSAEKLDNAVGDVDRKVQELIGLLNTAAVTSALKEVQTMTQSSNKPAVLTQTVQKLTNTPSIVQLSTTLVAAERISFDVNNIKQIAGDVLSKTGSVATFQSSIPEYSDFFNCLRNKITDEMAVKIGSVVKMAEKFRGADRTVLADGEAAVNGLVKSANDFTNLKTSVESLKGKSTADTKLLEALPTSDKHSKTIGLATLGVSNMEMALEAKAQADVIIANSKVVAKHMKLATDAGDVKNLGEVVKLKSSLPPMYTQLASWKTGIKPSDSTNLASFSDLYTSAKSVSGITGDFGAMAKSVEELAKQVTDPTDKTTLITVQKALEKLDSIDLNFVSYSTQFDQSKDTLTALDLFFVDSKTPIAAVTPAPKGPNGKHSTQPLPLASGQVGALTTTEASSDPTVIIIVVVVVVAGLIAAAVVGVVCWKRKAKRESSEKPNPNPKPDDPKKPDPQPKPKPDPTPEPLPQDPAAVPPVPPTPQAPEAPPAPAAPDAPPAPPPAPDAPAPEQDPPAPRRPYEPQLDATQRSEIEHDIPPVERDPFLFMNVLNTIQNNCKKYKDPKDEKLEKKWRKRRDRAIAEHKPPSSRAPPESPYGDSLQLLCEDQMIKINKEFKVVPIELQAKIVKNETRKIIALIEATRVKLVGYDDRFTNDYIHANRVIFQNQYRMILTQAPLKAGSGKLSTMEKFWWMVWQEGTKIVVMLNTDTGGDTGKCDYYFPREAGTMQLTGLTVTCTKAEKWKTDICKRELIIQFDGKEPHPVTHFQHMDFKDTLAPMEIDPTAELMEQIRRSGKPVVVHCSDGSRAGCLAVMEHASQELPLTRKYDIEGSVKTIRQSRAHSVQTGIQLAFIGGVVISMQSGGVGEYQNYYTDYRFFDANRDVKELTTLRTRAGRSLAKFGHWTLGLFGFWRKPAMNEDERNETVSVELSDAMESLEDNGEDPDWVTTWRTRAGRNLTKLGQLTLGLIWFWRKPAMNEEERNETVASRLSDLLAHFEALAMVRDLDCETAIEYSDADFHRAAYVAIPIDPIDDNIV